MANERVRVFFKEHDRVTQALRHLGVSYAGAHDGVPFDSVEYSPDHRLAVLTVGTHTLHVPAVNILLAHVRKDELQ